MTFFFDFTEQSLYYFYFWIALVSMPVGLVLLGIAWRRWYTAGMFLNWNRTNGTVQGIRDNGATAIVVTYLYEVNGKQFTGNQSFASVAALPVALGDAPALETGSRLAVLYDPQQPERAHINPQPPLFPYLELALGGSATFFAIISLVCIVYLLWAKVS